jgi:hypothetical protein
VPAVSTHVVKTEVGNNVSRKNVRLVLCSVLIEKEFVVPTKFRTKSTRNLKFMFFSQKFSLGLLLCTCTE